MWRIYENQKLLAHLSGQWCAPTELGSIGSLRFRTPSWRLWFFAVCIEGMMRNSCHLFPSSQLDVWHLFGFTIHWQQVTKVCAFTCVDSVLITKMVQTSEDLVFFGVLHFHSIEDLQWEWVGSFDVSWFSACSHWAGTVSVQHILIIQDWYEITGT